MSEEAKKSARFSHETVLVTGYFSNEADYLEFLAERDRLRSQGRYTLEDAATFFQERTEEDGKEFLRKLQEEVINGRLKVYPPGKNLSYIPDPLYLFYEEVYWDDLNRFLAEKEEKVTWRFPAPDSEVQRAAAPCAEHPEITPIPRKPYSNDWRYAIIECIRSFEREHGKSPNEAETWVRLRDNPPKTYGIKLEKDGSLTMGESSPLTRDAFRKRFERMYSPQAKKP